MVQAFQSGLTAGARGGTLRAGTSAGAGLFARDQPENTRALSNGQRVSVFAGRTTGLVQRWDLKRFAWLLVRPPWLAIWFSGFQHMRRQSDLGRAGVIGAIVIFPGLPAKSPAPLRQNSCGFHSCASRRRRRLPGAAKRTSATSLVTATRRCWRRRSCMFRQRFGLKSGCGSANNSCMVCPA